MGWSSGSYIAESLWRKLRTVIRPEDYKYASKVIFEEFNNNDADDWSFDDNDYDSLLFVYLKYNNANEYNEYRERLKGE